DQYSSGNSNVVADRSASVMIQSFSPAAVVYLLNSRKPCAKLYSFSRISSRSSSPQSPAAWRARKTAADWFARSRARSAPGVATIRPSENAAIIGAPLFVEWNGWNERVLELQGKYKGRNE